MGRPRGVRVSKRRKELLAFVSFIRHNIGVVFMEDIIINSILVYAKKQSFLASNRCV